jgi:hypothetical protein
LFLFRIPHADAGPGGNGINHWDVVAGGGDASAYDNNLSPSGQSVMSSGEHRFPFGFQLPEGRLLPGSFESRHGTVRYYVRVLIDVPYASPLQGLKYFTVVGPLIDRLDSRYNVRTHNIDMCGEREAHQGWESEGWAELRRARSVSSNVAFVCVSFRRVAFK